MPTTSTDSEIRFAGDVKIDKVEVVSTDGFGQDITNQLAGIQIFEDMFSPFMSGNITMNDTLDLINLFPFMGEEFLNIRIRTPSLPTLKSGKPMTFNQQFYIYKVTEREMLGDKRVVYKLHFISIEAIIDINKKVGNSFEGRPSDIVENLMKQSYGIQTKKTVNAETSPNGIKFVSNMWSPIKCINYAAKLATNTNDSPTYAFFENRAGFNFVSLESLTKQDPYQSFILDKFVKDTDNRGSTIKEIQADYRRITNISIPNVFNYLDRVRGGVYASNITTHDLVTKKYTSKNYDMLTEFRKTFHLNPYPLVSGLNIARPNANMALIHKHYGNFNGYADVTSSKTTLKRKSLMQLFEAQKVEITVPGRTDYTVGQVVNLLLYKAEPTANEDENKELIDKVYSGNYLVASINHYISRQGHECVMELIKDSVTFGLTDAQVAAAKELPKPTKRRLT